MSDFKYICVHLHILGRWSLQESRGPVWMYVCVCVLVHQGLCIDLLLSQGDHRTLTSPQGGFSFFRSQSEYQVLTGQHRRGPLLLVPSWRCCALSYLFTVGPLAPVLPSLVSGRLQESFPNARDSTRWTKIVTSFLDFSHLNTFSV